MAGRALERNDNLVQLVTADDRRDGFEEGFLRVGAVFGHGALEGEDDVFGIEGAAVVEGDALLQGEAVGKSVLADDPVPGKAGLDDAVSIDARQALEDIGVDHLVDRGGSACGRVEMGGLQHHAEANIILGQSLWRIGSRRSPERQPARAPFDVNVMSAVLTNALRIGVEATIRRDVIQVVRVENATRDRARGTVGRKRADAGDVGGGKFERMRAGREHEHRIAVIGRVHRPDRPCDAVMGHDRPPAWPRPWSAVHP